MGKKSKKKVQWRKLSINELRSKSLSDEDCDDENCEYITSNSPTPSSDSRSRSSFPRRSFHHPRDQNRFPHNHPPSRYSSSIHQNHHTHFDQNEVFLERGVSAERCPTKSFSRPFYQDNRTHFPPGQKRRQFKNFGNKGGFYTNGYPPYSGDQGPRRRWSEDESLALENPNEEETEDVAEDEDKPSQPVHTVFIDNEEYTKIQTPRQEVIFKKSSLDKKRDSVDWETPPSSCGSLTGCEPSSQGDQVSVAGSVEEPVLSPGDEPQCDEMQENYPYEDTNNLFTGDPGHPPLAGVVMQQAYPGGPMISIPVHWTQFLDPGLIPGDTALTPLDPTFTHIIDPKDLQVDPAHILPVQHDSNGCPVTVQVRVNADGQPVEIEPSAFTVSLSTLEPHQQEAILRKKTDILASSHNSSSEAPAVLSGEEQLEVNKFDNGNYCSSEHEETPKETNNGNKDSDGATPEQNYDCSPDSQYATMSEASTAPTTPSGELSDITDSAVQSKSNTDGSALNSYAESSNKLSRLDSLLETEPSEDGYCEDLDSFNFKKTEETALIDSHCSQEDKINSSTGNVESLQPCTSSKDSETLLANQSSGTDTISETLLASQPSRIEKDSSDVAEVLPSDHSSRTDIVSDQISNLKPSNEINSDSLYVSKEATACLESTCREDNTIKKKKKKGRCNSQDSSISSQTSLEGDIHRRESETVEPSSKYQIKKNARKLKKEKKRLNKEKNKAKVNSSVNLKSESSTETKSSNIESSSKTSENIPEKDNNLKVSSSEVKVSEEVGNTCTDHIEDSDVVNDVEDNELNEKAIDLPETTAETDTSGPPVEKSEKEKAENENNQTETGMEFKGLSAQEYDENYICKQGFVMVPILTPYYDPAVLYGCQVVVPENIPERSYNANTNSNNNRKKKKKNRKRYHEDNYLDTELYAGEPFVSTPNGYIVPMDASHLCQLHGYQYIPSMFPHIMSDEDFVSPYMHEHYREIYHRRLNGYGEKRNRYSKHYEESRKKNLTEAQQQQEKGTPPKDILESADSGVSEAEELAHLNLIKISIEAQKETDFDKEAPSKKSKGRNSSSNCSNEIDPNQNLENGKSKSSKKKKKNRKKNKKEIIEILEPDFSSFDTPTPRFEVRKNDEVFKPKQNKNTKNKKKKVISVAEDVKDQETNDLPSSNKCKKSKTGNKNFTAKNSDQKIDSHLPSSEGKLISEKIVKADSKVSTKNKKSSKAKNKNKSQKLEKKEPKTLEEKEELCFAEASNQSLNSSLSQDDRIISAQVPDIPQTDEIPSQETSGLQTEESFACVSTTTDQDILSQESGIGVESEESLNYNESYDASILSQEDELNANEQETAEQSDESKGFHELGNENYEKCFYDEMTAENVTCSDNETTPESIINCSDNEMPPENVITCSDNEMIQENVTTCSDNEVTPENIITCSDNEMTPENFTTCSDDEMTPEENVINCSGNDMTTENFICSDNEITSESVINSDNELISENLACSDNGITSQKIIACSGNDITSEDAFTCSDIEASENVATSSEFEKTVENIITCTIDTEKIITKSCENSQNTEIEDCDIYMEDTILTSELDSELLQKTSLATPEDLLPQSETIVKDNSINICDVNLDRDSKCDDFVLKANKELILSENPSQIVSFKDLGVTEAVKKWIIDVTPEKAFCITDETRSIIFPKSKEVMEIEREEESDCEEISETLKQSKNVLSNPSVASPSENSLGVSSERVASFTSSFTRESGKVKALHRINSANSQDFENFDKESFDNFSRERLYSSSSSSSFPLCPLPEDSSTLLDDPRVYDPSVYSKYYQLGADVQMTPSNSSTRESTLSPSFVGSEDVDFHSKSGSATPTENYTVSIATELLKSEKIRANMAHISPSFGKDALPMPHCGSSASCSDINSEIYDVKIEKGIEVSGPGYSESSSGIGSSLASTPNTSPYHQFPSETNNSNSRPKLEPHPLVNLSVSEGQLPCRTMCCSVM